MRHLTHHLTRGLRAATLAVVTLAAAPLMAQNVFSPAATVNDSIITEYEVAQRMRFLTLLSAPGSGRDAALDALIDETLRDQAVAAAGIELTEEQIQAGMQEFAERVELDAQEFIAVIEENGVAEESFRDFVSSGIAWREYVRSRFGPRTEISEEQIDRALSSASGAGNVRVLLSEIVIPTDPQNRPQVENLAQQIAASESEAEFAEYAREFSAAATRTNGGRLPWRGLEELPPALRPLLLSLAPGETSEPIPLPNAVAVFLLRDIEETGSSAPSYAAVEYAVYFVAGGAAEAARIRARVDACDDLYGEAQGQPPEVLQRETRAPAEIPQDIAGELGRLDPGETSITPVQGAGETVRLVMLCGRTAAVNEDVDRAEVAQTLRQARLNEYAESLLAQLRADARIEVR